MKIIKSLCVIPARSGSKRIPKKNIKSFANQPIISFAIEKAIESKLFDEIMVSTDSTEIATIAEQFGAKVPFVRSAKTSDDFSTISDVIIEVLEEYSKIDITIETICVLFPTVPLLEIEHLKQGYRLILEKNLDSVFSIKKFRHPIERALVYIEDNSLQFNQENNISVRTQDFIPKYYDAGQFYFVNTEKFVQTKKIIGIKNEGIILNFLESVDIDNEDDWQLAELLYQKVKTQTHDT